MLTELFNFWVLTTSSTPKIIIPSLPTYPKFKQNVFEITFQNRYPKFLFKNKGKDLSQPFNILEKEKISDLWL